MHTHQFHKTYLKISAIFVMLFGPIFFLGTFPETVEPIRFSMDLLIWPLDSAQSYEHPETVFLGALAGGFLLGWGVLIWRLSDEVYDAAPEAVRKAVVTGFLAWFVLDSAGSITSGNASNALFNIIILALFVGPLWRSTRPEHSK
ncbi:MAG: hypothetical protein HRT80_11205 [Henriciella sp.]|nr:hypothetical protein [Henriciella sp.]